MHANQGGVAIYMLCIHNTIAITYLDTGVIYPDVNTIIILYTLCIIVLRKDNVESQSIMQQ